MEVNAGGSIERREHFGGGSEGQADDHGRDATPGSAGRGAWTGARRRSAARAVSRRAPPCPRRSARDSHAPPARLGSDRSRRSARRPRRVRRLRRARLSAARSEPQPAAGCRLPRRHRTGKDGPSNGRGTVGAAPSFGFEAHRHRSPTRAAVIDGPRGQVRRWSAPRCEREMQCARDRAGAGTGARRVSRDATGERGGRGAQGHLPRGAGPPCGAS